MRQVSNPADLTQLRAALESAQHTGGSTHNFYLYPARFSPEIARTVIEMFSEPGDCVLDPFMGGGTSVIEGLMLGRSMVGVDVNALACFVAATRTRPLSASDAESIRTWATNVVERAAPPTRGSTTHVENLPRAIRRFLSHALTQAESTLRFPRQQAFARCVLLRLGQWAVDCREDARPVRADLAKKLLDLTEQFLGGLHEFADSCSAAGLQRNQIVGRRLLLCRSAAGLEGDPVFDRVTSPPRLVFTSPPYACVHVLYHRWQIHGRRETPAPYWVANVADGYPASHYTAGSRTPTGERNYFLLIRSVFSSVAKVIARDGIVIQLVGFADAERQLPLYLGAMADAGFEKCLPSLPSSPPLRRTVPNRKWYAKLQGPVDASSEFLLFHRPRARRRA